MSGTPSSSSSGGSGKGSGSKGPKGQNRPPKKRPRKRHPRRKEASVQLEAELTLPPENAPPSSYEEQNPLVPDFKVPWGKWLGGAQRFCLAVKDWFYGIFSALLILARAHRQAVLLGCVALALGSGLGMVFAVLERPPGESPGQSPRQPSGQSGKGPKASVSIAVPAEAPDTAPLTPDQILEQLRAEGFTLEEPDGVVIEKLSENAEVGEMAALSPPVSAPAPTFAPPVVTTEYGRVFYPETPLKTPLRPSLKPGVPRQGKDEAQPWRRYAVASEPADGRAMIAVVVDDLGLNYPHTEETISLAGPLTLAFLPYGGDLSGQTRRALRSGHELLVHMPMEPQDDRFDPGPKALTTDLGEARILENLSWNLERFEGFVGINNHMGSKFTAYRSGMETVMREVARRGLLFLDSRTTGATTGEELALHFGVPHAMRHVFLDNVLKAPAILSRLKDLEAAAQRQGFAIGICHPHGVTLDVLKRWLAGLDREKFILVPLSAIVEKRTLSLHQRAEAPLP